MKSKNLFKEFDNKLQYFKSKNIQALQASGKNAPNVKKTIDDITKQLKAGVLIDDNFDNDKIIMRPKGMAELKELSDTNTSAGVTNKPKSLN